MFKYKKFFKLTKEIVMLFVIDIIFANDDDEIYSVVIK